MKSKFKPLGQYIHLVDERNREVESTEVLGINIDKYFMPSVANVIGTDLRNYKLLKRKRFACNPMHVGRDKRLPVAVYMDEKPAIVSPAYFMFEIKDDEEVLPEFLMLCFRSADFDRICTLKTDSSVRGGITWEDLCSVEIPVPDISVQRKIVYIFTIVTDRIELLEKINRNLSEQIKLLYSEYFEGKKATKWNLVPLSDLIFFQEGPGIRNWQYVQENGTKFINIRCINNGDIDVSTANMISNEEADGKYAHFMLKPYDIVMSCSGTLGRYAIVREEHLPLCLNTSVIRFSPAIDSDDFSYVYGFMTSREFLNRQREMACGSVQANFGPTHLKKMEIHEPPKELRKEYHKIAFPIIQHMISIRKESDTLARMRDTLLPKLMSGELDVSDLDI